MGSLFSRIFFCWIVLAILVVGFGFSALQDGVDESSESVVLRLEMKDGQVYTGLLVRRDDEQVVLLIAGIETVFDTEKIVRETTVKDFDTYYKELKKQIRDYDFEGRLQFCRWIYERGRLELAVEELELLLDDDPSLEEARDLLIEIRSALILHDQDGPPKKKEEDSTTSDDDTPPPTSAEKDKQTKAPVKTMLNKDDVNLLRVYEIDLGNPPPILIPREAIDRLLEDYKDSDLVPSTPRQVRLFYQKEPIEILKIMFQLKARSLYPMVRVLGEPPAINRFRHDVHRNWLVPSCATNRCHGGAEAGRFQLHNRPVNNDRVVYTNLVILDRMTTMDGIPLINFGMADRSPVLQMGLPRSHAIFPHPAVPGWKPVFESEGDPLFGKGVNWIKSMYRPNMPDGYPVEFTLPGLVAHGSAVEGENSVDSEGDIGLGESEAGG